MPKHGKKYREAVAKVDRTQNYAPMKPCAWLKRLPTLNSMARLSSTYGWGWIRGTPSSRFVIR